MQIRNTEPWDQPTKIGRGEGTSRPRLMLLGAILWRTSRPGPNILGYLLLAGLFLLVLLGTSVMAADPPAKPNILFAIADDWSYGHAGAYGCRWIKTPAFDRVAQQGLLFNHAYTPNAKCAPSRSCILTGRNPWQLKAAANHVCYFPPEFRTYAEALDAHGYFVGMTAKGWAPGVATNALGKPRLMTGRPFNKRTAAPPAKGISRNDYAANFADFLEAIPAGQPWCFWYGSTEPHRDYEFGSGIANAGKKLSDIDRVPQCWPDNEMVRNDLLDYAVEVEHFDRHLGRMLDLLEKSHQLDNTLVVVTSDNGMPFPHAKGQAYENSNHLPLAVMWKEGIAKPGRIIRDFVSFIDFAPTFLEVAQLSREQSGMAPMTGRSLADIFYSDKSGQINPSRNHVLIGKERTDIGRPKDAGYPIRGIMTEEMLYLQNFEPGRWPGGNPETGYLDSDGSPTKTEVLKSRRHPQQKRFWDVCFGIRPAEELFQITTDPDCVSNLAATPGYRDIARRLRQQLFDELKMQQDPRILGQGRLFDEYPYASEEHRGFYERFMNGEKLKAGWINETDFEAIPFSGAIRPNILWLVAEDMGPDLSCTGTREVWTPHLDRLASEGVRYTRFYNGMVCSPSRSAFMTGMYATTIGAHQHRTVDKKPLPDGVRIQSDWMRDAGYYTANLRELPAACGFKGSGKTDWNFLYGGKPFDSPNWSDLKSHQPFYAQLNFQETHRPYRAPQKADPAKVIIPPYYPDHPITRQDWAQYLDSISELDRKIGRVLAQLEADGLASNTVVVFFGDNGQSHVRGKQFCYEEGLHAPLIIRWPKQLPMPLNFKPGSLDHRLIEGIDLAPSMLDIVGVSKPAKMQGRIFIGNHAEEPRRYAFGARDRCDETAMRIRAVRDEQFRYIRNFTPEVPFLAPNAYKEKQYPVWNLLKELNAQGKLTPAQAFLCQPRMPDEELYDLAVDPHQIHNLADSDLPEHQAELKKLREVLEKWIEDTDDQGRIPETLKTGQEVNLSQPTKR